MKISACTATIMLITIQLMLAAPGNAQDIKTKAITIQLNNQSLGQVLIEIGRLSELQLAYPSEYIKKYNNVVLQKQTGTVSEILKAVLEGTGLEFSQRGKTIVIAFSGSQARLKTELGLDKIIKGKVTDVNGNPIPGASVKIKDTEISTITNIDGTYTLNATDNSILLFSFIGFINTEIAVGDKTTVDVILKESANNLDEVLVVGYGTVKRKDLTGSVSQVNMAELIRAPVASFDQALAGRVAGVQVSNQEDGQPGSGMSIIIRGANSLTQSNSPLYVIDGFPIEDPQNAGINPDDIESINILKDASATAIYGARAANGVIVIETKKGQLGKPVVSYSTSLGLNDLNKSIEMLSPYEFVKYEVERYTDPDEKIDYLTEGRTVDSYRNVEGINWQDLLFRTGATQIHNIALRGASKQTKYSISGSLYDSKGVVMNTGYKRHQVRVSIDQQINDKFKAGLNANFNNQNAFGQFVGRTSATSATTISGYLMYSVWAYRPVTGGDVNALQNNLLDSGIDPLTDFRINPIISADNTLRERHLNNLTANAYLSYDLTKELTLKITGGFNGLLSRNDAFYNDQTVRGTPARINNIQGNNGSVDYGERADFVNENTLTWTKKFNDMHQLELLGGYTMQSARNSSYGFSAILVPNESLGINGLSQGTPLEINSTTSRNTLTSFVSRANYNYGSRYLLTATFRADGSSKFAPENRWSYFPSGAIAWRIENEQFMRNIKFISAAKLRVSYGITGNNRVSDFAYLPAIDLPDLASYSFNNERFYGLNITSLGNKKLKWESTEQIDVGLDLGLLKDRINFTADIYRKTTFDLLLNANLEYSTGLSRSYMNIGKVQNQGLELTLNTVNIKGKKFQWTSNLNISFNNNKILALNEGEPNLLSNISSFVSRMAAEPLYIAEVGKPAAMFYGLIWDGVYQYDDFNESGGVYSLKANRPTNGDPREVIQPGDIKYKDINHDGVVDASDKTVIGRAIPIHTGGFSNNLSYGGLDLNVLMQWGYGNKVMNANRLIFEGNITNVSNINQYATWANRWTPENQTNELFRTGGAGPQVMSSRTLEDGSYLRLKTVSLSYTLPTKLLQKLNFKSISFNVSAQNLYTFTNYSGLDPEVSVFNSVLTPGFDFSAYPNSRTIVFGIKATL